MQKSIKTYSQVDLENLVRDSGQPKFRTKQLIEWLYTHRARSYEEMTNLPKAMREALQERAPLTNAVLTDKQVSSDGTRKYLFTLYDGCMVETVAMPSLKESNHLTVCFSTQSGCPMGCSFCATGQSGFSRNLGMGEIIDQVLDAQEDMGLRVSNLVAMGQGEPFLNYESLIDALHVLNNPKGIAIGARKITVSTCGLLAGIRDFANEPEQFTLAVSLHSARQNVRNDLMPGVRNYSLKDLRATLERYIEKTNRRVTFEYLMIDGVNDGPEDLNALISYCSGLLCHINFLAMNEIDGTDYRPSSPQKIKSWVSACNNAGIQATVRNSRGSDICGACGQLRNAHRS